MRPEIVSFALVALIAVPAVAADSARDLNTQGYRLYQQKKHPEAMERFQQAIEADPKYALPYYNLACVLSILRAQGKVCDYDAYKSRIIQLLEDSIHLDPRRRKRLAKDPDLAAVRDTFGYFKLLGLSVNEPDDLRKILIGVTWYGPSPGAYGPMSGADFHDDGNIALWNLDFPDDGPVTRAPSTGTWKLDGTKIRIRMKEPFDSKREFVGTLGDDGSLKVEGLLGPFGDDPDECSA